MNEIPLCSKCKITMKIDHRKPKFISGLGQKPRVIAIGYTCPKCGKRKIEHWEENRLPDAERTFCQLNDLNV